jgi:hypothetical protein
VIQSSRRRRMMMSKKMVKLQILKQITLTPLHLTPIQRLENYNEWDDDDGSNDSEEVLEPAAGKFRCMFLVWYCL